MRRAPLAMRLRANSTWAMLEFVFNGMVFLLLGLAASGHSGILAGGGRSRSKR